MKSCRTLESYLLTRAELSELITSLVASYIPLTEHELLQTHSQETSRIMLFEVQKSIYMPIYYLIKRVASKLAKNPSDLSHQEAIVFWQKFSKTGATKMTDWWTNLLPSRQLHFLELLLALTNPHCRLPFSINELANVGMVHLTWSARFVF